MHGVSHWQMYEKYAHKERKATRLKGSVCIRCFLASSSQSGEETPFFALSLRSDISQFVLTDLSSCINNPLWRKPGSVVQFFSIMETYLNFTPGYSDIFFDSLKNILLLETNHLTWRLSLWRIECWLSSMMFEQGSCMEMNSFLGNASGSMTCYDILSLCIRMHMHIIWCRTYPQ